MTSAARVGDTVVGTCYGHLIPVSTTGTIVQGSPSSTNGTPIAMVGMQVITGCGHSGVIVTGDPIVTVDGAPMARVGDQVSGTFVGTIDSGSPNVR